jgi:nitroreductase
MTIDFPDNATVRAALSLANRAPSVHNSQPWRWRVGPHSLHLYAEDSLHLQHADPDRRELVVSCGAALNHCTIALAALGWQTRVHRLPNPSDRNHLASIETHRTPAAEADVALAAAIPRRRTDRRYYSSWSVPLGDVALMGARAARSGVVLRRVETSVDFRALLARAVYEHVGDPDYLAELTTWSGRYASTAGVPARNTPESDPSAMVPGRLFAGTALAQPAGSSATEDDGVVLALGTASDGETDRLRAGEAASLVLLTATAQGLGSCPITEPLEIAETREALRQDMFGGEQFPQMLLRIGWAPVNADPLPATPRRPLSEVVTNLDGSAFEL